MLAICNLLGFHAHHEATGEAANHPAAEGLPADEVAGIAIPEVFHHGKVPYSCNSSNNNTHATQIPIKARINIIV